MSVHLGILYHWSPRKHRGSILEDGLKVMEPCNSGIDAAFPWVCLGTTPSSAYNLLSTGDPDLSEEPWDLWQVRVREGDRLTIRGDFAPYISEVRVHHGLPADRVWWVAERDGGPHV